QSLYRRTWLLASSCAVSQRGRDAVATRPLCPAHLQSRRYGCFSAAAGLCPEPASRRTRIRPGFAAQLSSGQFLDGCAVHLGRSFQHAAPVCALFPAVVRLAASLGATGLALANGASAAQPFCCHHPHPALLI